MIHLLIALWMIAIGIVVAAPASSWLTPWGTAAVAPAIGTALYIIVGTFLAAAGAFSVVIALTTATALALALLLIVDRRTATKIQLRNVVIAGGWALGLGAAVTVMALNVHTTRLTLDSFGYLLSGSLLDQTGGLDALSNLALLKQQLAVPLLQATGWFAGDGYSPVVAPLFATATLATLGWLAARVMRRYQVPTRRIALLLSTAGVFLLTTNRFVFHATYINGHMLVAMLMLIAIGIVWLSVIENEHRYLYLPGLAFAAISISRSELLMVIALFLIPILAHQSLTLLDRLVIILPATVVSVIWFGLVLPPHEPGSTVGTLPLYGNAAIGLLLGAFAVVAGVARLQRVIAFTPWLMLGGAAVLLVGYTSADPQILVASLRSLAINIAVEGAWGSFWYVVLPLIAIAMVLGRVEEDWLFNFGIAGFFLTLPLFAYFRGTSYRAGAGDSANRMLLHIVPLLIVYLLVAAGRASVDIANEGQPTRHTPS